MLLRIALILQLVRSLSPGRALSALLTFLRKIRYLFASCSPPTSHGSRDTPSKGDSELNLESRPPAFAAGCSTPPSQHAPISSEGAAAPNPHLNVSANNTTTTAEGSPTYEISKHIPGLVAITTKGEYERYDRVQTHDKLPNPQYEISSFQLSFSGPELPQNWTTCVHPEGVRYFRRTNAFVCVLTEAWIHDDHTLDKIERYIESISTYVRGNGITLPLDTFLVLELRQSGRCGYYFVNHQERCLFWLDPFDFSALLIPLEIPHTTSHVALLMQSHYWYHNELFPHVYQIDNERLNDIADILVYSIGDLLMAGETSLVSVNLKTLRVALELVRHHQDQDRVASYLSDYDRFLNLFGERVVRLNAYQSIYPPSKNSWIMRVISPLMMFGPEGHLGRLKDTTVDYMVTQRLWDSFTEKTFGEWRETILYATVLLNSNVAFLAIQSVDAQGHHKRQSDSQRASYLSVITSLGSIIFGLLMLRQHRGVITSQLIANRSTSDFGLEALAIVFSLPYTLLMWSMLAFLLAFFLQWYHSEDFVVIGQTIIVAAAYIACMIWSVTVASENSAQAQETTDEDTGPLQYVQQLWNRAVGDDRAL
ncbi:hypothetical protein EST38_g1543 [Candolleomyces aberdarensis]|uniref:Uncharacterized protein n=1 Tax=Candolleomyces aberdarensis TaxID=2316362 RepID=A0A4Q2DYD9_9AGAR|nr:hypothetical protein EST38_g1543 [Candolleomyces aberdarensis]